MPTEEELLQQLAEAEKEYEQAKKALARAKRLILSAETEVINRKIQLEKIQETVRVFKCTSPSNPEITLHQQEIIRFREDHPELVEFAKERDRNKP